MSTRSERLKILDLIGRGEITSREGTVLLEVLGPIEPEEKPKEGAGKPGESIADVLDEDRPEGRAWQGWWHVLLGLGTGVILLGVLCIYLGIRVGGVNFWYLVAAGPYILGLAMIVAAVQSWRSAWLQFRIKQTSGKSPREIHLGIPLPLGVVGWLVRRVSAWRGMNATGAVDILDKLTRNREGEDPLVIHIDGKAGEKVDVWIVNPLR